MKMIEVYGKVKIGDFEFYGQIKQDKFCTTCEVNLVYYDDFDAWFCPKCNDWIESTCSDPNCKYCPNRPVTPLPL